MRDRAGVGNDLEPCVAAIGRAINPVRPARAPTIQEIGEVDVIVTGVASGRVRELRPRGRLGRSGQAPEEYHQKWKKRCGAFHLVERDEGITRRAPNKLFTATPAAKT